MIVKLKNILFYGHSKRFYQVSNYTKYTKTLINRAKIEKERYELVHTCITSALKNRKSLSASEFKSIETELQSKCKEFKHTGYQRYAFKVLVELQPPNDSLENVKNFITAFDIKNDLRLKPNWIKLYTKKATETNLTDEEEQELIHRFVI